MSDPATVSSDWLRALADPERAQRWSLVDWDRALRLLRRHRLLARLAFALQRTGLDADVPPVVRAHLVAAIRLSRVRTQALRWTAEQLRGMLGGVPGPHVLLKGAAYLAQELPIAAGRLPSDLDILVAREHLDAAHQQLFATGWREPDLDERDRRYYLEWSHELPPLQHPQYLTELDVHHNILPSRDGQTVDSKALLGTLIESRWPGWQVLAPVDQLLHCAAHLFFDAEPRDRVRDLVDLDGLMRHFGGEPEFWIHLPRRAEQLGLVEPLTLACHFTTRWLGTTLPGGMHDWLQAMRSRSPGRRWLQPLMGVVLAPTEPDRTDSAPKRLAATLVLARYHWHRLPLRVLIPHLWRKWRAAGAAEPRSDLPDGVTAP